MKKIERSELLPIAEYEPIRTRFRARIIDEKKHRRLALGPHISAVFENRDTAMFQIQEMLRTERITSESGIAHELETYNDLIPGRGELSVTVFVEIPERELRDRLLIELAGLEESIWLDVGGERLPVRGKPAEGAIPGRTTAVHYFKVRVPEAAAASLRTGSADAALLVDHPQYQARTPLPRETQRKLAEDLSE